MFSACTAGKVVQTHEEPDFDIHNYQSFDFSKPNLDIDQMPQYAERVEYIKDAIKKNLTGRGIVYAPGAGALLVNIGVVIEEKTQTRETDLRSDPPMYMGQRNYHWEVQEVPVGTYKEGTFTLDLVDKESNKMVWQGVATGVITKKDATAQKEIQQGTDKLLAELDK
ncbi:lipoprotein [Echinicola pacifica]|uniref:Lipoprotein n=2 Tax=Echinicola pacifica TaxID=346377 RepID=A0A918UT02_9BACT|nr:lipoprotein [Echinicola pacifica]